LQRSDPVRPRRLTISVGQILRRHWIAALRSR